MITWLNEQDYWKIHRSCMCSIHIHTIKFSSSRHGLLFFCTKIMVSARNVLDKKNRWCVQYIIVSALAKDTELSSYLPILSALQLWLCQANLCITLETHYSLIQCILVVTKCGICVLSNFFIFNGLELTFGRYINVISSCAPTFI